MHRLVTMLLAAALLVSRMGQMTEAGEEASPPPLPVHTSEGTSGAFLCDTAYFTNLAEDGALFGKPSVGVTYVDIGHKDLWAFTITTNVARRFELGYSSQRLSLGDWPSDVQNLTGMNVDRSSVDLHTLSARALLVEEGAWDLNWMPAIAC